MPYIAQADRDRLDDAIEELADRIVDASKAHDNDAAFTGLLNYASTTLALRVVRKRFGAMRYWIVAAVTGTFRNVAEEFYRRVGVPYEDAQIAKNGDTKEYAEYDRKIDGS